MTESFCLKLGCAYCFCARNSYSPSSNKYDFKCVACQSLNFVTAAFDVKKVEDVSLEDVVSAFEMSTNASYSLSDIRKNAKSYLRGIKNGRSS